MQAETSVVQEIKSRLKKVRSLIQNGEYDAAQAELAPLQSQPRLAEEIAEASRELARARTRQSLERSQLTAEDHVLREVAEGLLLPSNYGQTVTIARDQESQMLPPGPMEEIVRQKITMRLASAGVKEIVSALSDLAGVNIIADEALEGEHTVSVNVRDVPLHELLSYIARNMGIAFHLGENLIWVTSGDEQKNKGPQLETRIYHLKNSIIPTSGSGGKTGDSEISEISEFSDDSPGRTAGTSAGKSSVDLEKALKTFLDDESVPGSSFQIFQDRNLMVVKASLNQLRLVEKLLTEFDRIPQQVLIEARFVTIAQSDLFELGVEFPEVSVAGGEKKIVLDSASSTFADFTNQTTGGNIELSGILDNFNYQMVLHALQKQGSSRTLSAPRITALNNQNARIRKGDKLYYFEDYDLETSGGDNPSTRLVPSGSPQELELGITLDVHPIIASDGKTIMLALSPAVKTFLGWEDFESSSDDSDTTDEDSTSTTSEGLIRLPKLNETQITTTVAVQSGETVVLGGMVENVSTRTVSKVPILGDLPLLGSLFRRVENSDEPEHLLIFVTAKLVGPDGRFVQYAEQNPPQTSGSSR
jgi:type II secretory pathway component GspD/PulD (secretin)